MLFDDAIIGIILSLYFITLITSSNQKFLKIKTIKSKVIKSCNTFINFIYE